MSRWKCLAGGKMANDDRERAKQIVLEIIRQAGGVFENKTNLYKAFYHAHLQYAETQPGYLSTWPIVHMPRGPGIDRFNTLLGELLVEGKIEAEQVDRGDYTGFRFTLRPDEPGGERLPLESISAIKYGVSQVIGKSAKRVSDDSHEESRAWRNADKAGAAGAELNIYLDSLSEEEYQERMQRVKAIASALDAVWS